MNVKFRKATASDWEKIYPLLEGMGLVRNAAVSQHLFLNYIRHLQHCFIVAEVNQMLVGYS